MKKLIIIIATSLTMAIIFIVILLFDLNNKDKKIIELKDIIKKDSAAIEEKSWYDKHSYRFKNICIRVIPESTSVTIGDSFKVEVFTEAYEMIKNGKLAQEPFILLGSAIDTTNNQIIGHADTIKQNYGSLRLSFSIKTDKIGNDSCAGIYCLPDPIENGLQYYPFYCHFVVVEKDKFHKK
jgi:hypothetical protein